MTLQMASPTYSAPSDSMQVFILAVKRKLDEMQITQGELARRTDISATELSKILKGKKGNCTLKRCDLIASALNTTTVDLFRMGQ